MKNLIIIATILLLASCCPLKKDDNTETKTTKVSNSDMKTPALEDLQNKTWYWVNTKMNDGTTITPEENASNIIFGKENKINIQSDCNKGSSTFTLDGKSLNIAPIMATKMFCKDSKEKQFFNNLMAANSVFLNNGKLFIELKMDSGTMEFIAK